jgi:hypothetical protein
MAKRPADSNLRQYAVIGAEQRLLQIAQEAANIFRAFPELRTRGFMESSPAKEGAAAPARRPPRRQRRMSAAARKAVSARMKKYWAERRNKKKKG